MYLFKKCWWFSSLILIITIYFGGAVRVHAATVYSKDKIGTPINLGLSVPDSTRYYGYYFKGATLGNPPTDVGYWTSTSVINKVRVKKISGSCNSIGNTIYITGPTGNLLGGGSSFSGTSFDDYCDATTITDIPVGTKISAISVVAQNVGAFDMILHGSIENEGILINGNNDGQTVGGFAFQLCDNQECDQTFSVPEEEICDTDCFSNVLFLPGLQASRLYTERTDGSEDQLWEPNINADVEDLYLNTNGISINSNIYTNDIIKESNISNPLNKSIYKSFSETMDGLVTENKITAWEAFAYDWRQSPDDVVTTPQKYPDGTTKSLIDVLQSLAESSKSKKITIVTHSNGGLVAKALLKKLQDDKVTGVNNLIDQVDVLIMVAAPQIGTASAVPAVLHGYDQGIPSGSFGLFMDVIHARELGRNMLGAYGLFPSKEYLNRVNASPVTFVDNAIPSNATTKLVQTFGSALDSYTEYKSFLFGGEGRVNPSINKTNLPISLSQDLFSKAENLHNEIDNWIPPESMRVIEIAGWGIDTIASFEYSPICESSASSNCIYTMDQRPRFTKDGDKTVVVPSAQYIGGEKYWVNLFEINNDKVPLQTKNNHANIMEVSSILNFTSDTIQKISFDSEFFSTTKPVDTSNRLRLSIHSPVTLDAYDAQGNHTGKICPSNSDFCYIEENIPNSSYLEFGEGKYLNLPEDKAKSIKLQGTDIGTFTYESEKVLPNGTSSATSFIDIPVTTQTQVEITNTGTLQMKLDVTGDGVIDFTLAPSVTFDPIVYLQIMKTTVDSLDIPIAKIKAFDTRVDNIIKSIQKGKIDKAKLKADKFKTVLEKKLTKPDPKHPKPKKLSKTDAQLLLDMLNKLLDNLS